MTGYSTSENTQSAKSGMGTGGGTNEIDGKGVTMQWPTIINGHYKKYLKKKEICIAQQLC